MTKIIFFGTPEFAIPSLNKLKEAGFDIVAVITAPDKEVGRKKILTPSPIKTEAEKLGLNVLTPAKLKDENFLREFKELQPEVAIIVSYGKIIPKEILEIPPKGFLNVHPSLLPKYRGPTPIQSALLNGEEKTGISIMLLDEEMDHGPILAQTEYEINPLIYCTVVFHDLSILGTKMISEILPKWIDGEIQPKEQDHSKATYTKKFEKEDAKINWNQSAKEIYNQIRALNPEPGTWTTWKDQTFNIKRVVLLADKKDGAPGEIIKFDNEIGVGTTDGTIVLEDVQLAGNKEMTAKIFSHGHLDFVGSVLE